MTDAVAKLAAALDTFDRVKHNFQSPGQVEKALNSITALEERLLLLRGSDSDIVERPSAYDQVKGDTSAEKEGGPAKKARTDSKIALVRECLKPLQQLPAAGDFLKFLLRQDGRRLPVSFEAFDEAKSPEILGLGFRVFRAKP